MYENYERIKMIKHVHENDEDIHQFDMDWLIRQAERADEYDRNLISLEDNRHYVSGLEQQNKCYREAIREASKVIANLPPRTVGKTKVSEILLGALNSDNAKL